MEIKETLTIVLTISCTLFCKWLWDRYFSQNSRVTKATFDAYMKNIDAKFETRLQNIDKQLLNGQETFKNIGSLIGSSCLIMLEVCKNANIDCTDIKKKMTDAGLNL